MHRTTIAAPELLAGSSREALDEWLAGVSHTRGGTLPHAGAPLAFLPEGAWIYLPAVRSGPIPILAGEELVGDEPVLGPF